MPNPEQAPSIRGQRPLREIFAGTPYEHLPSLYPAWEAPEYKYWWPFPFKGRWPEVGPEAISRIRGMGPVPQVTGELRPEESEFVQWLQEIQGPRYAPAEPSASAQYDYAPVPEAYGVSPVSGPGEALVQGVRDAIRGPGPGAAWGAGTPMEGLVSVPGAVGGIGVEAPTGQVGYGDIEGLRETSGAGWAAPIPGAVAVPGAVGGFGVMGPTGQVGYGGLEGLQELSTEAAPSAFSQVLEPAGQVLSAAALAKGVGEMVAAGEPTYSGMAQSYPAAVGLAAGGWPAGVFAAAPLVIGSLLHSFLGEGGHQEDVRKEYERALVDPGFAAELAEDLRRQEESRVAALAEEERRRLEMITSGVYPGDYTSGSA